MFNKKNIIISILIILTFYVFAPKVENYFRWRRAAKATGGFPYQIGLTGAVIVPCFTTGVPPVCAGGALCYIKDPATCSLYSDVSGVPAGGDGANALFLKTSIAATGLIPGGQLIAGGMGPTMMDNGVLASDGGCYGSGCVAIETGPMEKIKNWIYAYIIAGKK